MPTVVHKLFWTSSRRAKKGHNNRDIRKCQSFRTTADNDDDNAEDARAMTIP